METINLTWHGAEHVFKVEIISLTPPLNLNIYNIL